VTIIENGVTQDFESITNTRDRVIAVTERIVQQLESPSTLNKVKEYCNNEKGNSEVYLLEGILKIIDDNSDSAKVFNSITQDIVAEPATIIKTSLFMATKALTRDDSSKDGWRVIISFTQEEVIISHERKELSMDLGPSSGYSFVWIFSVHFDATSFKLRKTDLQIKNIQIIGQSPLDIRSILENI